MNKLIQLLALGAFALSTAAFAADTYYIDSASGRNSNRGDSPKAAYKDFTKINGKTLNPGDRLLIKRGSVINQELRISARGTEDQWVEIGTYGTGARPIIRRNWDIRDRCVIIKNPDYLRIHGLTVCYAGKGLIVSYSEPSHVGLVIEDCIAHHIEGIYREWVNCTGIPEWRDYNIPQDDGVLASPGIGVSGRCRDITIRDCDVFQNSWGFTVSGEQINMDRNYCHHNYVFNSSPHPALFGPKNSIMQNCIFDAAGYHGFAGTMGIMLGNPQNLTIQNCIFRNQPDSGTHDEGGLDFENHGNGCLIDNCTFENNAGAAIEVLGLSSPQPKNVEIRNSRFIENNWAKKLGPAEIYIWGATNVDPRITCSTGIIHSNGCVLLPGVSFFTNLAPATTSWSLKNNRRFASSYDLEQAMPYNKPPVVEAGSDITTSKTTVQLKGSVYDDSKPEGNRLRIRWEVLEGPGTVTFKDQGSAICRAKFSAPGDYLLRLVGDDGQLWTSDMVSVHIVPWNVSLARSWEFNTPLNKEGWTEFDLGTTNRVETEKRKQDGGSLPVHYVAGGYYIVVIENAPSARLQSKDNLIVNITNHKTIRLRCQNHTTSTRMVFRFTTTAEPEWNDANSRSFEVLPSDDSPRDYVVDMSTVPGWTGDLKQLRLDLSSGTPASGTCRIDHIRIEN